MPVLLNLVDLNINPGDLYPVWWHIVDLMHALLMESIITCVNKSAVHSYLLSCRNN